MSSWLLLFLFMRLYGWYFVLSLCVVFDVWSLEKVTISSLVQGVLVCFGY